MTICIHYEITSSAIRRNTSTQVYPHCRLTSCALTIERIRCLEYISCWFFLSPASRVPSPSRLVITAVVIGPETAVALVQLRRLAILRPMPLKPGDSPRYIRHLHRRRYIPSFPQKRRPSSELAGRMSGSQNARHRASRYFLDPTNVKFIDDGKHMRSSLHRWKDLWIEKRNSFGRRKNWHTAKTISIVRRLFLTIFRFLSAISPFSDSTA